MMSPRTRRNLLIALLVLLALLIAFLLWWFLRKESTPVVQVPPTQTQTLPASTKPTVSDTRQQEEQQVRVNTASLQTAAKTFAERYGSYSAEANFANLTDVLPLMTDAYRARTEAYVETATPPAEYYAVTTRVITVTVDKEDGATAHVTLTTQREEAKGSVQNISVRYQDLVLTFFKDGDTWLVDSATWL